MIIDSSLNRKIMQNENRFKALLSIPKKRKKECNLTDRKGERNIRNIKQLPKNNFKNNNLYGFQDNETEFKNVSLYASPRIFVSEFSIDSIECDNYRQNNKIKVNQKLKKEKKLKHKLKQHSMINLHYAQKKEYNRINTIKIESYAPKKKLHLNIKSNHNNQNNSNNLIKDYSTIEYNEKNNKCFSPRVKKVNFEEMIGRFQKDINKKKEWVENQKKKKEEEEKKLCSHAPKMDKNSMKINLKLKNNFFERQKIKIDQKKKKEEKLKAFINKKKEEEINKTNFLLTQKAKKKKKDNNLNHSISKTVHKNFDKINNLDSINRLFEWDIKRKEKINQKRKKKFEKIEGNKHIPKINKRSETMAKLKISKSNARNIFDRLAKLDSVALEKKKILVQLYTPSFQPNINSAKKINHIEHNKDNKYVKDDKNENEENEEIENEPEQKEEFGITNLSNHYLNDDDLQQIYRNVLFNHKKKD